MAKEADLWGDIYAIQRFAELVAATQKKEWVGLTDDDIDCFVDAIYKGFDLNPKSEIEIEYFERLLKFIDRKLKEKNAA
jgi:hypothetical protein